MHECVALRNLESNNFLEVRISKQLSCHLFDRLGGSALADADCHGFAVQHQLVATLHRELLVAIIPNWNIVASKSRVMINDIAHEQRLAATGWPVHLVDRQTVANRRGWIARKVQIRHWI